MRGALVLLGDHYGKPEGVRRRWVISGSSFFDLATVTLLEPTSDFAALEYGHEA